MHLLCIDGPPGLAGQLPLNFVADIGSPLELVDALPQCRGLDGGGDVGPGDRWYVLVLAAVAAVPVSTWHRSASG
jgi:hypothetical protein